MTTETAAVSVPRPGAARLAVATIFCLNGLALANWIARIPDVKQQLRLSDQRLGLVLLATSTVIRNWISPLLSRSMISHRQSRRLPSAMETAPSARSKA